MFSGTLALATGAASTTGLRVRLPAASLDSRLCVSVNTQESFFVEAWKFNEDDSYRPHTYDCQLDRNLHARQWTGRRVRVTSQSAPGRHSNRRAQ